MKISFHGAARTVTGSKHLIHLSSGKKVLLDCGMFQGLGRETMPLNRHWGFEPSEVTYVILSHAHIDHVGLLPKLVKDGFAGRIFATSATADLAAILMRDSARIQEMDVRQVNTIREREGRDPVEPLYTEEDAAAVLPMMHLLQYDEPYRIDEQIELLYTDCGHLLGSAAVNLKLLEEGREVGLTFSGDVGRYHDIILRSPQGFPQAEYLIMESTYGNSLHDMAAPAGDVLLKHIKHTCLEKGGKLIIPAFSVGRTQEVLYLLNRLELERRLPDLPYYVDSPLSVDATGIIKQHPECFNSYVHDLLVKDDDVFQFQGLQFIQSAEESIRLGQQQEPCVIISASGMAEAGRVRHHIAGAIEDPKNTVLLVGYCEPNSLGGKLKAGARSVKLFGDDLTVRADVEVIASMSAHGDYDDLLHWLSCQDGAKLRKIFLVHGEYETQVAFRDRLQRKGYTDVEIPELHAEVTIGDDAADLAA